MEDQKPIADGCSMCGRTDGLHDYHDSVLVIDQRDIYREALVAIMGASSLRKAWEIAQKGLEV